MKFYSDLTLLLYDV